MVGAGLAGLSAAIRLQETGWRVVLHEGTRAAGGRCRSYHDSALDLTIDNGNHLVLSGNRAAMEFARRIGGDSALSIAGDAAFPFADLGQGRDGPGTGEPERWTLRPNAGRLPWWVLSPARRVPGTRARDYLAPAGILRARPGRTIGEAMTCDGPLWRRLWHPVLLAALNTEPEISAASLAAPVLRETLGAGGRACRPVVATGGLSAAFVEPALVMVSERGGEVRLGSRIRAVGTEAGHASRLDTTAGPVELDRGDVVVLATPPWVTGELMPGLTVPDAFRGIVNAHFRMRPPPGLPLVTGMIGSLSEWLFAYPDRLSVTISGADRLFDVPREELAHRIWPEVARVAGLDAGTLPPWQIVREKRATFAATPAQDARRPQPATSLDNVVLAGDWVQTGLPATIEGSIRSGEKAASLLQDWHGRVSAGVSRA